MDESGDFAELPEAGHGFETDPEWDTAWDDIPSPWELSLAELEEAQ